MCTEFFLAIIYFIILSIVNFFLFKLLSTYQEKIFILIKFKKIFASYKQEELKTVASFYFYNKNPLNYRTFFKSFSYQDIVIIGNLYKKLQNITETKRAQNYYLKLAELQYLSSSIQPYFEIE